MSLVRFGEALPMKETHNTIIIITRNSHAFL